MIKIFVNNPQSVNKICISGTRHEKKTPQRHFLTDLDFLFKIIYKLFISRFDREGNYINYQCEVYLSKNLWLTED